VSSLVGPGCYLRRSPVRAGADAHLCALEPSRSHTGAERSVANMASYAISSSLILVIHDDMIIGTNHIVLSMSL
jgi:hypothetical protein